MQAVKAPAPDYRTVGERSNRDLARTAEMLARWLGQRMQSARDIEMFDLAWPQGAGMSNETILLRARWKDRGEAIERELTGFEPRDLQWYEVFAGYKLATIVARRYASSRDERPNFNLNDNAYTRAMADIMGVAAPTDVYMHPPT